MTKDEILEEIRAQLQEALVDIVEHPWIYTDEDLERSIRSALRFLRVVSVTTDATMDENGTMGGSPTEAVGLLIAYRVSSSLLSGDLIQKLLAGEMGLIWKMGTDYIDSKTTAIGLKDIADEIDGKFNSLLTIVITSQYTGSSLTFGGPTPDFQQ